MTSRGSSEGKPLLFVVGNSRSGTTMMGRILGSHPAVFTFHELHFFEELWSADDTAAALSRDAAIRLASTLLAIERVGYLARRDASPFVAEAERIVDALTVAATPAQVFEEVLRYEAAQHGRTIPCDQTPRNVYYIGEILTLYPDARVIVMVRDPRDVLLSQKLKWRRRQLGARNIGRREALRAWLNYHPITITKLWTAAIRAGQRAASDARVHVVRFEDLIAQPERMVRETCVFAGIDYRDEMLAVPHVGSSTAPDEPSRRGVDPSRTRNWTSGGLTDVELSLCQRIAAREMEMLGYEPVTARASAVRVAGSVARLPLQLGAALLFNLSRMRNVLGAIRRRMA